ncbi:hypothetical protein ACFQZI_10265 [Mucilaginibacter lutimaris]|uniref:Outer membrane protein beta-barrel domain-containing protein n=1 Tax=Mucilaginibacter lutimaris TaxID=931629 RepID=A0ABW2ZG81_9SPHI
MKRTLCVIALLSLAVQSFGQKVDVSVFASANFSHYTGNYPTATTFIGPSNLGGSTIDTRENNPYGNKYTFGNSFGVQAQYVSKQSIIGGLEVGLDRLISKVHVDEQRGAYPMTSPFDATSKFTKLFFNINPYLGYRLAFSNIRADLMPGVDIGLNISSHKKVRSAGDENIYLTDETTENTPADFRLRFGSAFYYKRIGLTASYSRGLKNYVSITKGSETAEARSELIRFGLIYNVY